MSRLDDYRRALLAAHADVSDAVLGQALEAGGDEFAQFVTDYGLGPLWHERTGDEAFRESRMAAEARYALQERALREIEGALGGAGIEYAVIKGAACRVRLFANPAIRACHDLDLLVRPQDKLTAARRLVDAGYAPAPEASSISREIVLSAHRVDIDLHWALLREGRLRHEPTADMLSRRCRVADVWVLGADDALFVMLVHPAFAKHLAGWDMGLHRVRDLLSFLRSQQFDWPAVRALLRESGVSAAAWATLRWAELLAGEHVPDALRGMRAELEPGGIRRAWLDQWLRRDLSERLAGFHSARLLGFSWLLHDTPGDILRAVRGRRRAARRSGEDLAAFAELLG